MTGRHVFATGHVKPKERITRLARFCAVGNHWQTREDEALHDAGCPTVHGACVLHAGEVVSALWKPTGPRAA